jgi:hypothetical protein
MKLLQITLLSLMLVGFLACNKDEPEVDQPIYLVKAELVSSLSATQALSIITIAALGNPDFQPFIEKVKYGVNVYYVEYNTDYTDGKTIVASGLVAVPDVEDTPTLLLSFQSGTIVEHADAPTQNPGSTNNLILQAAASLGFTICISDNIGFGASADKVHPYLIKVLFQKSVVNLVQAVKELENKNNTKLNLSGDLFFTGYSLGGWASFVAHKYVEDNGLPGFNLIGSGCGAGAYNLIEMRDYLLAQTDYVQPYYLPFLLWGYRSTGDIESDLSLYFQEPYATRIPTLYDGLHSGSEINAQLTSNISELMVSDLIEEPNAPKFAKLTMALQSNSQGAWMNQKPIHFFHGTNDVHVPYSITENLVDQFRVSGQNDDLIQFTPLAGADHVNGSIPMFLVVLNQLVEFAP